MCRILFLLPGPAPPPERTPQKNRFYHLSRYFRGDLLQPIRRIRKYKSIETIREINAALGNFGFHFTLRNNLVGIINHIWDLLFYLCKGVYLHYFNAKYDVIIAYGPFKTGFAGFLIKIFTRTKLIIEVPGNPRKSFIFDSVTPGILNKIKTKISDFLLPFIINRANHVKLLYPKQLDGYENIRHVKLTIFHDFTPIKSIRSSNESDKYILFLGFPWYLKGVDILIKAFKLISNEFPEYRLKIVGYCPDKSYFRKLAEGNNKIELCDPVFHDEAMKLMSKCALFILPSRTEAMGRVLLEAMASKKPIIASNVDGIPYYIKHGFNGLLFEPENVEDLASKMKILLSNPDYASKLAENGHKYAHQYLSEKRYVECFKKMVDKVLFDKKLI